MGIDLHLGSTYLLLGPAFAVAAWLVYVTRPDRPQNKLLALTLLFEGAVLFTAGAAATLTEPADVYAVRVVNTAAVYPYLGAYLLLLGTLSTPVTALFRHRLAAPLVAAGALAGSASAILWSERYWGAIRPYEPWGGIDALPGPWVKILVGFGAVAVFTWGVVAAFSAWRRAPRGSSTRAQAGAFLAAFGLRDLGIGLSFLLTLFVYHEPQTWGESFADFFVQAIVWTAFLILLVYGIMRHQLFDIDLRIKWGIRRGTLIGIFIAAFVVVAAVVEQWLQQYGVLIGGVAVGLLLLALRPLERAADRLANVAMPRVHDTAEYRIVRKREVYRAAVESAIADGVVSEKERDVLATLADQLGLAAGEARAIEREAAVAEVA